MQAASGAADARGLVAQNQVNTNLGSAGPLGPGLKGLSSSVEKALFGLTDAVGVGGICHP